VTALSRVGPVLPGRVRRVRGPVLLAGAVLTLSVLLHLRDPHRSGSWGYCPWLLLTGTYCPGCGGLRAVNDLARGDLAAAASSNLLLVGSMPVVVLWWARSTADRWRGVVRRSRPRLQVALAVAFGMLALGFAVLRNTGAGAWLAP
jgi:hypothetical protein